MHAAREGVAQALLAPLDAAAAAAAEAAGADGAAAEWIPVLSTFRAVDAVLLTDNGRPRCSFRADGAHRKRAVPRIAP